MLNVFGNRQRQAWGGGANASGRARLSVNTRRGESRRDGLDPLAKILLLVVLGLMALGVLAWGVWKTGEALFWGNPRYAIRHIVIRADGPVLSEQHVREYTGVREGQNLFAVDMERIRDDFLGRQPNVRSMSIVRHLPDTLTIAVVERSAIARIGRFQNWGVDRDGWVFPLGPGANDLPIVTGLPAGAASPGKRVPAPVFRALDVVDACRRTAAGRQLKIASIDVSPRDRVELYLAGGETVRLAWEGMGTGSEASLKKLDAKLASGVTVLRSAERRGKRIATLDWTFGDQYIPAQEY